MLAKSRIALVLVTSVFLSQWEPAISSESNATQETKEDETGEAGEYMNLDEFKERFRRLIPYMTYYVANNHVNSEVLGETQSEQGYDTESLLKTTPLRRKPQRLVPVDRPSDVRNKPNSRRLIKGGGGTLHKQEEKFTPSVQYDPADIGGVSDHFAPVRFIPKLDRGPELAGRYKEYERPQQRPIIPPELMGSASGTSHHDVLYYQNDRPRTRPYNTLYERKYLPQQFNVPAAGSYQDLLLGYGLKTPKDKIVIDVSDSYTTNSRAPVGFANNKPPQRYNPKPTRILAQSVPTRPLLQGTPAAYPPGNVPPARLVDIMKTLQLTNRLPEMLNKNNIDSSLETLIEILGILNNDGQSDFTREPIKNSQIHRNVQSHNHLNQVNTRPRVVTEMRFQATPSTLVYPEQQTLRYEPETTYRTTIRQKIPPNPNYKIANNNKNEDGIRYYAPFVQDIHEKKIDVTYQPIERPIKLVEQTEQMYEDDEDLPDGSLEDSEEKHVPTSTETPFSKFKLPDGPSTDEQLVPPTTLKFGVTRGKPNVHYPAHATIPETEFNCKEQRYKGFFGDPSTGCQVWHYCDLNGGKSSFLCPNGTIFSQVALTCDWWFNVKCESTTQLYVLNERLYKYILPVMPKFPEDFSGPEVDRYLELMFKEMEAKLKAKKLKKQQEKDRVAEKLQALDGKE